MKISNFAMAVTIGLTCGYTAYGSSKLRGKVKLDGSSTVFPVAEAVAEEFQKEYPRVRVTVGLSGTGGGFKKFTTGETDISNASRPIKGKEQKKADENKINMFKIPVAYDGISVALSSKNTFAHKMTLAELKKAWEPGSKVKTWKDIKAEWPAKPIKFYGPGADSGTFDFFTEEVMGKSRASRSDYVASEDDNVLVRGISADRYSMGYFGYAYYVENQSKLNVVSLSKDGKNYIKPAFESIKDGSYPLARPLLIYVNLKSAQREEVAKFVEFFIQNAAALSKEVGYIPLPKESYEKSLADFRAAVKSSHSH